MNKPATGCQAGMGKVCNSTFIYCKRRVFFWFSFVNGCVSSSIDAIMDGVLFEKSFNRFSICYVKRVTVSKNEIKMRKGRSYLLKLTPQLSVFFPVTNITGFIINSSICDW